MDHKELYAVYTECECISEAAINLSAHEVVKHIYREGGGDYRLSPEMVEDQFDDDDNELPDVQRKINDFLVFEVWFKNSYQKNWRKSIRWALGKTKEEAEESFLKESWEETRWDDSYWTVVTMLEHDYWINKESNNEPKFGLEKRRTTL